MKSVTFLPCLVMIALWALSRMALMLMKPARVLLVEAALDVHARELLVVERAVRLPPRTHDVALVERRGARLPSMTSWLLSMAAMRKSISGENQKPL